MSAQLTVFGALFLPVGLGLLLWRPSWLLGLLVVSAVFQAPAVATLELGGGGYGITPFNATCALIGLQLCRQFIQGGPRAMVSVVATPAWTGYLLWSGFLLVAALGALILPRLFEGVLVHPALVRGVTLMAPEPNRWSISNLAQALNCAALWVVFSYARLLPERERAIRIFLHGLAWALACSLLAGVHQRLAMGGLVPMFLEFWGSNPSYNQWFYAPEYGPKSFQRVGLPFVEPSYASVWFAALMCGAATVALYGRLWRREALLLAVLAALGLFNTMGTSGLLAGAGFLLLLLLFHAMYGHRLTSTRVGAHVAVVLVGAVVLAGVVIWDYLVLHTAALTPLRETIAWTWSKVLAYQGSERDATNRQALIILLDTHGLGAGAGSSRASSYFLSLLANTGIPGLLLFLLALARQCRLAAYAAQGGSIAALALLGALLALLIGVGSGIPDQSWPVVWVLILGVFLVADRQEFGAGDARSPQSAKGAVDVDTVRP